MINETLKTLSLDDLRKRYNDTLVKYDGKVRQVIGFEGPLIHLDLPDGERPAEAPEVEQAPIPPQAFGLNWRVEGVARGGRMDAPPPPQNMNGMEAFLRARGLPPVGEDILRPAAPRLEPNPDADYAVRPRFTHPEDSPGFMQIANAMREENVRLQFIEDERQRRSRNYRHEVAQIKQAIRERRALISGEIDRITLFLRVPRPDPESRRAQDRRNQFREERRVMDQWLHDYRGVVGEEIHPDFDEHEPIPKKKKSYESLKFDYRLLDTERPSSRWYVNKHGTPVYLFYANARQYQRGHNQRNTYVRDVTQYAKFGTASESWKTFRLGLEAAYAQMSIVPDVRVGLGQFHTMAKARKHLILSPTLLVTGSDIWYRFNKIGSFQNRQEVLLEKPDFAAELSERIAGIKIINGD